MKRGAARAEINLDWIKPQQTPRMPLVKRAGLTVVTIRFCFRSNGTFCRAISDRGCNKRGLVISRLVQVNKGKSEGTAAEIVGYNTPAQERPPWPIRKKKKRTLPAVARKLNKTLIQSNLKPAVSHPNSAKPQPRPIQRIFFIVILPRSKTSAIVTHGTRRLSFFPRPHR